MYLVNVAVKNKSFVIEEWTILLNTKQVKWILKIYVMFYKKIYIFYEISDFQYRDEYFKHLKNYFFLYIL